MRDDVGGNGLFPERFASEIPELSGGFERGTTPIGEVVRFGKSRPEKV